LRTGDAKAARAAFSRADQDAAQGRRYFVDPLLNLAALAIQSGDRVGARSLIDRALERNPGSERAREMLASLGQ
jgi:Tfp pilus assembly protein PilF